MLHSPSASKYIAYVLYAKNITFSDKISAIPAICAGCHCPITDQYILRVAPNLEWHASCLKCDECNVSDLFHLPLSFSIFPAFFLSAFDLFSLFLSASLSLSFCLKCSYIDFSPFSFNSITLLFSFFIAKL